MKVSIFNAIGMVNMLYGAFYFWDLFMILELILTDLAGSICVSVLRSDNILSNFSCKSKLEETTGILHSLVVAVLFNLSFGNHIHNDEGQNENEREHDKIPKIDCWLEGII